MDELDDAIQLDCYQLRLGCSSISYDCPGSTQKFYDTDNMPKAEVVQAASLLNDYVPRLFQD